MDYITFFKVLMWVLFLFCLGLWALKLYVYGMYSTQATDLENNLLRFVGKIINWVLIALVVMTATCMAYVNYLEHLRNLQ